MKKTKYKFSDIIENTGLYIVGIFSAMFSFFLFSVSMLHTNTVDVVNEGEGMHSSVNEIAEKLESVIYYDDNLFINLIVLALMLIVCFIIAPRLKKIKLKYKLIFIFLWTFAIGTIWVISSQSAPSEDSAMVTGASMQASNNDMSFLDGRYFRNYSFQLGYVLFNEILIRAVREIYPVENLLFLEVFNAFFLAVINMFAVMINDRLFRDERVTNISVLLLALSAAPVVSCSFIYGIFPGMMFAIIALYCEMKYLLDNNKILGIVSAVCIAAALMIKSNYLIWLIAMSIIFVISMFRRKKYILDIIFLVLMVVPAMMIQPAVKSYYEKRAGVDLGDSIPYISWIAMGLNESDLAPGWYTYFLTVANFEQSDFDAGTASTKSIEEIKRRVEYFSENPQYANDFFYKKIVSQWNETSYESIWNNIVRRQYAEKGSLAQWACYEGKAKTKKYMDYVAQLVFCGFFAGTVYMMKKKKFYLVPFPLVFLGGFFYQIISEGKSQYIMPYFIVMTAFAAFGTVRLYDIFTAKYENSKLCRKLFITENTEITDTAQSTESEITESDSAEEDTVPEETEINTESAEKEE